MKYLEMNHPFARTSMKAILALACCVSGTFASAATTTIRVYNTSKDTIWVTVDEERKQLVESTDGVEIDRQVATSLSMNKEGSVGIPEVVDVSSTTEFSGSRSTKDYSNITSGRKYSWSPFIEAGEQQLPAGRHGEFEIESKSLYFLTVRTSRGFFAANVAKSAVKDIKIYVDNGGVLYSNKNGRKVRIGDKVRLQNVATNRWLGVEASDYATVGSAPGTYTVLDQTGFIAHLNPVLKQAFAKQPPRYMENSVQIYMLQGGKLMYSSAEGWARFDDENLGEKSMWSFQKVLGPHTTRDEVIRTGDYVEIQSHRDKEEFVGDNGDENEAEVEDKEDFKKPTNFQWRVELVD